MSVKYDARNRGFQVHEQSRAENWVLKGRGESRKHVHRLISRLRWGGMTVTVATENEKSGRADGAADVRFSSSVYLRPAGCLGGTYRGIPIEKRKKV